MFSLETGLSRTEPFDISKLDNTQNNYYYTDIHLTRANHSTG